MDFEDKSSSLEIKRQKREFGASISPINKKSAMDLSSQD